MPKNVIMANHILLYVVHTIGFIKPTFNNLQMFLIKISFPDNFQIVTDVSVFVPREPHNQIITARPRNRGKPAVGM